MHEKMQVRGCIIGDECWELPQLSREHNDSESMPSCQLWISFVCDGLLHCHKMVIYGWNWYFVDSVSWHHSREKIRHIFSPDEALRLPNM
mmetsp:Transcript_7243/g.27114  ORF Transcript_7243/g.27114 Transcript_7243/m.27114 type:complete len:90 (-) Transcript_7243:154-423(-)